MKDKVESIKKPQTPAQEWASKWNYSKHFRILPAMTFLIQVKYAGIATDKISPILEEAINCINRLFKSMTEEEMIKSKNLYISTTIAAREAGKKGIQ